MMAKLYNGDIHVANAIVAGKTIYLPDWTVYNRVEVYIDGKFLRQVRYLKSQRRKGIVKL